jgi:hypothetical protein
MQCNFSVRSETPWQVVFGLQILKENQSAADSCKETHSSSSSKDGPSTTSSSYTNSDDYHPFHDLVHNYNTKLHSIIIIKYSRQESILQPGS